MSDIIGIKQRQLLSFFGIQVDDSGSVSDVVEVFESLPSERILVLDKEHIGFVTTHLRLHLIMMVRLPDMPDHIVLILFLGKDGLHTHPELGEIELRFFASFQIKDT